MEGLEANNPIGIYEPNGNLSLNVQSTAPVNPVFLPPLGTQFLCYDDFLAQNQTTVPQQWTEGMVGMQNPLGISTYSNLNQDAEFNQTAFAENTAPYVICSGPGESLSSSNESNEDYRKVSQLPTCLNCGAIFTCESDLQLHWEIHKKLKQCPIFPIIPNLVYFNGYSPSVGSQLNLPEGNVGIDENASSPIPVDSEPVKSARRDKKLEEHSENEMFECNICQKTFGRKGHLTDHIRTHTKEKPFQCNVCQKTFTVKGDLIKHVRIHTGEKPFECSSCQKTFVQKNHLIKHERTHRVEMPLECNFCDRIFVRKYYLIEHKRAHIRDQSWKRSVAENCV